MKKKFLDDVPFDKYFNLKSGSVLKSLRDLHISLPPMDNAAFSHHVNPNKNDFSNWIRDVIGDKELANKIQNITDKKKIRKEVGKRLKELEKVFVFPSARKKPKKSLVKPLKSVLKKPKKKDKKRRPSVRAVKAVVQTKKKKPAVKPKVKKKPKRQKKVEKDIKEILEKPAEAVERRGTILIRRIKKDLPKIKFVVRPPQEIIREAIKEPNRRRTLRDFLLGIIIGFVIAILLKGLFC